MTSKRTGLVWVILAAGLLAWVGALIALEPPPADAAPGECPPGYRPIGPDTGGDFFDQNVAVFAGGDFSVIEEAAEAEGVVVALGNASFQRSVSGVYNVGVVGVGSGVSPNPMSDMLIVGGGLSGNANTTVQVGANIGGNIVVGGTIAPGTMLDDSGGSTTSGVGAAATAPYAGLPALIQSKSAEIAALANTGTVAVTSFSMTFHGDGTSNPQVFTVSGAALRAESPTRSLQFKGIPEGAAVYINVTGPDTELQFNALLNSAGTIMDPNSDPEFVEVTTHTLWNFPEATSVLVGGSAQLPGSILVPNLASVVTNRSPGLNGRVYVNGDLIHGGVGAEMHNYPFLPSEELECLALLGGFTIEKEIVDPDNVVDPGQSFFGTYSCTLGGSVVASGFWSTLVGERPPLISGVEVGAVCTVEETPPAAPPGYVWGPVDFEPDSVTITDDGSLVGFTVTNTLVEVLGGFTVDKLVVDPDGLANPDAMYSGTFSCTLDGADVTPVPNTWSTTAAAGPVAVTSAVPVGSVCTLVETPPTSPDGNYAWEPAQITPSSVTVTELPTAVGFTVTNTLAELPGGFTIAKIVENPDAVPGTPTEFTGTYTCTLDDVEVASGNWSVTAGAAPEIITDRVPLGSVCTITEDPPAAPNADYVWQTPVTITPASVTIANADTNVGFTVTNTLIELPGEEPDIGGFTIDKVVNDPDGLVDDALAYSGTWSCTLDGAPSGNGTWTTTAGAPPVTVTNEVLVGSECTIVETPPTSPDTNHAWQPAVINPNPVTITNAGDNVAVTATNTLAELPGGFTITKVVNAPDGVVTSTTVYSGTWSCTLDGAPAGNGTWSTTAGAAPIVVTTAVPLGSICTIVETPPAAPGANHAWQPAQITPSSVTITNANTNVGFTVTNTATAVLSTAVDQTIPVSGTAAPAPAATPTASAPTATDSEATTQRGTDLAVTGSSSELVWLVWIGLLGVLLGIAMVLPSWRARRRNG